MEKTAKSHYSTAADRWAEAVTSPLTMGAVGGTLGALSSKESEKLVQKYLAMRGGWRGKFRRSLKRVATKKARRNPAIVAGLAAANALLWGGGAAASRLVHGRALRSRLERGSTALTSAEAVISGAIRRKK